MDIRAPAIVAAEDNAGRFRIATYNIHKCKGFDRRTSPTRIASVLQEINADVYCLQEVVDAPARAPLFDQAAELARALPGYTACFGSNRALHGGLYGNLTLSRLPVLASRNIDITQQREPRGVLRTDVSLGASTMLHIFNVHLGTGFVERRSQARRLMSEDVLAAPSLCGPRIIVGDFNEWVPGLTTKLLRDTFNTFRPRHALGLAKTFPGMLPFLTLDHCYYKPPLRLIASTLWRSKDALIASDHLPLVGDFDLLSAQG